MVDEPQLTANRIQDPALLDTQVTMTTRMSGPAHAAPVEPQRKFGLFSSRKTANELSEEVDRLGVQLTAAQAELCETRAALSDLGVLDILRLNERRRSLRTDLAQMEAEGDRLRSSAVQALADLEDRLQDQKAKAVEEAQELRRKAETEMVGLRAELESVRTTVCQTQETAILQEIGIYEYRHPLTDAAAYQAELAKLSDQIKAMTRKDGGAITAAVNWTVNGSMSQGKAMVRDFSKLMLRAYNAEADNLVRGLKPALRS